MLSGLLPTPKYSYQAYDDDDEEGTPVVAPASDKKSQKVIPNYPYRLQQNFVPLELADFGDGGSYPEIHVVQYPLDMGKPGVKSTAVIAVNVDENGQVKYDALVKQGANRNKLVQTSLEDIKEKTASKDAIALPDENEEQATVDKTRQALEALLDGKIKSSKPTTVVQKAEEEEPQYIRYTPNPNAPGFNGEAKQRVIRMVEAQVDPMEPPKHKHKKVPKGPGSPPVPVLHSPPRKLTVADQQAWKVPPCISNWKNARGYTIPLDKRLAADGRGLQEITINNKFATLSEALYISERKAAEDLRIRNQIRKKMALKEKEDKEQQLREMALKARMERAGVSSDEINARMAEGFANEEEVDDFLAQRDVDVIDKPLAKPAYSNIGSGSGSGSRPQGRRDVDNRPAWMTQAEKEKLDSASDSDRSRRSKSSSRGRERRRSTASRSNSGSDWESSTSRSSSRGRGRGHSSRSGSDKSSSRDRSNRRRDNSRDRTSSRRDSRDRDSRRDSRDRGDRDRYRNRSRDEDRDRDHKEFSTRDSRYYMKDESPKRERKRSASSERDDRKRDSREQGKRADVDEERDEDGLTRQEREKIRIQRRKERERQLRLENMKGNFRKNKIDRDANRDVSEKVALGMHKGSGQLSGEALFDSRLFNQSAGLDAGFGAEDEYTAYSKPLFARGEAASVYRPKRDDSEIYGDAETQLAKLKDTSRFRPDKGFKGAEGGQSVGGRDAPVQFEKARDDPFEVDEIVQSSKRVRRDEDDDEDN